MTRGRHSPASRNTPAQRRHLIAAPLVTCAVIGAGVILSAGGEDTDTASQASASIGAAAAERSLPLSRDTERTAVEEPAKKPVKKTVKKAVKPRVVARRWTTADLDLRIAPKKDAPAKGELEERTKVAVTGVHVNGFAQVKVKERLYWVTNDYLAIKKPTSPTNLPIAGRSCPGTSGVESGLTPAAIRVYRAVCNNFPQVTSYGGRDGHGEHADGRAIDIVTSDVALGTAIADFLRSNAGELGLSNVIWRQRIFTVQRASEGWRAMPDRGSPTANHFGHVHVSVN